MRYPRLKPSDTDTFMHVYNRVAGSAGEFPFGPAEKEYFLRRLTKLCHFYVIEVIAFQVMGNHYHLLLHIPTEPPSNQEVAERYQRYYDGKRTLRPDSEVCTRLALKMRDISAFMQDLQQPFTRWFNRTRPVRRRGHLWADRFKNTILEDGLAVWDCWKYIEMNPVRAYMVANPAEYRFCSFGRWAARGRHPFERTIIKHVLPRFQGLLHTQTVEDIKTLMQTEFARIRATESQQTPDRVETAVAVAAEKERFSTRMDRRVRYWVDGLVIGSEIFVKSTMARARGQTAIQKRRLVRAINAESKKQEIYCFRQLRVLLE